MIRWCDGHIEYEADPRQAEKLISECGLEGPEVKQVATPGVKSSFHELEGDKPLEDRLHTAFRRSAARGNYLAADRLDAQFACKEVCRYMANPTERAWQALKRICCSSAASQDWYIDIHNRQWPEWMYIPIRIGLDAQRPARVPQEAACCSGAMLLSTGHPRSPPSP